MIHKRTAIAVSFALGLVGVVVLLWLSTGAPTHATAAPPYLTASSGAITVCLDGTCDFSSIQDAVDAAMDGICVSWAWHW